MGWDAEDDVSMFVGVVVSGPGHISWHT
jgi:hypothetical protein